MKLHGDNAEGTGVNIKKSKYQGDNTRRQAYKPRNFSSFTAEILNIILMYLHTHLLEPVGDLKIIQGTAGIAIPDVTGL